MPVSAKDAKLANRRSTASTLSPVSPTYGSVVKEKQREAPPSRTPSRTSLVSFTSAHSQSSFLHAPPSPPFASSSRSGSYSSIESTLSLSPPPTPGLTVSRSPSVISEDEVDEFGAHGGYLEHHSKGKQSPTETVRTTSDAEHVESAALTREKVETAVGMRADSTVTLIGVKGLATEQKDQGAKVQKGKGTLRRAWRRVVQTVKG